jgi:transglutaminase-like putative cysteine protease
MRYRIVHTTDYHYEVPVQTARHLLHLAPRGCAWQHVESHTLSVVPEPTDLGDGEDVFGNPMARVELAGPHEHLHVASEVFLRVEPRPWHHDVAPKTPWESIRDALCYHAEPLTDAFLEAQRVLFESPGVRVKRELEAYAAPSFAPRRSLIDATRNLMQRIHHEFRYDPEATEVGTTVIEVLQNKHGVCQDFAHLMIACLRSQGLAARYVSGYLRTDPPPGQPRLVGADASHAWVAVFFPDAGWIEFDPTNNCLADERHIVLGWGRDFGDVSPIRGVIQGGGEHTLKVAVTVTPLDDEHSEPGPHAADGRPQ